MTKEDFEAWSSSPVTREFIKYIQYEIESKQTLSESIMLNSTVEHGLYGSSPVLLEQLGMDSLARLSCIKGLEYAIDKENFHEFVFGGENES